MKNQFGFWQPRIYSFVANILGVRNKKVSYNQKDHLQTKLTDQFRCFIQLHINGEMSKCRVNGFSTKETTWRSKSLLVVIIVIDEVTTVIDSNELIANNIKNVELNGHD